MAGVDMIQDSGWPAQCMHMIPIDFIKASDGQDFGRDGM